MKLPARDAMEGIQVTQDQMAFQMASNLKF